VGTVVINGRVVMEKGRLLSVDERQVMADVNRIATRIRPRAAAGTRPFSVK
jgi:hypothetical protein